MKVIHFLAGLSFNFCSPRARSSIPQATLLKGNKRCWRANINSPSTIFGQATN